LFARARGGATALSIEAGPQFGALAAMRRRFQTSPSGANYRETDMTAAIGFSTASDGV
jgi:hypothetical protein